MVLTGQGNFILGEEENKILAAVAYARFNRYGDPHELDQQAERICDYCQENGIELRVVLSEEAERSMSCQILEGIVQNSGGKLDMVVVAEMCNLSRDVGWLLLKQAEFETQYGVTIVSAKGSQLSLDKHGGMTMA
ncbi:recombinase family protein [Pedobacter sp. KBS0701]|uniref:recombinase family protein n=1 Tax=Pedobacter sp. KBS0701 TaxID=2578106 RepID=UPI00110E34B4|nr:recombinase family protein [Pedobacter sp. KBS0701]QDW25139.1 recombinase family protein [Pedobacter sp. KBS0701]